MPASASITQADIAAKAQVSVATVSKCLASDPSVSPATRARVLDAADRLDYSPPRRGKTSHKKNRTLGVLMRSGSEAGYAPHRMELLEGLSAAARERGVRLAIDTLDEADEQIVLDDPQQLPLLRGDRPAGLILWQAFEKPREAVDRISLLGPCVLVNNNFRPELRADAISPNHFDGMVMLAEHLHGLGHRRIGLIGDLHQRVWGPQRTGAFLQAMLKLDLPDDPSLRLATGRSDQHMDEASDTAIQLTRSGVTAWIALKAETGWRLQRRLREAGFAIPGDVSLACVGSAPSPDADLLPITGLRAPWREIGRHAVLRLLDRLDHPEEPGRRVLMNYEFIPGATTASPPAIQPPDLEDLNVSDPAPVDSQGAFSC